MSDTKKPTVSEIRAFQKLRPVGGEDYEPSMSLREIFLYDNCAYLLDLVERMGKALDEYGDHTAPCDVSYTTCTCGWEKSCALLEELRNSDD